MKYILGFIVSSVIWFFIFSIKIDEEEGVLDDLKGLICPANTTLFIRAHEKIGDPFELIKK